jgi:hypothetical protein
LSQPRFAGADDGLRAIGDLELGEDVRDVVAHRLGAQVEALRDLGVRLVLGDQGEDLVLAVGELGKASGGALGRGTGEVLYEALGDRGPKIASPLATARIERSISALRAPFKR